MLGVVQFINEASDQENKNDLELALKMYKSAYNNIVEVNGQVNSSSLNPLPGASLVEVRSVADFINHRVCNLQFTLNHPRESIAQFRRYIDTFRQHTKEPEYIFEHTAWLSQQYLLFAELFSQAISNGTKASRSQHPGYYYHEAVLQMIDRRKNITEYTNDSIRLKNLPVTNELFSMLVGTSFPLFLKQCGWDCVDMSIGPPVTNLVSNPDSSNQKNHYGPTSPIDYSDIIIRSLYKAKEHFEEWDKPRMLNYISVMIADEYLLIKDLSKAQALYKKSIQVYERENWVELANDIRSKIDLTE